MTITDPSFWAKHWNLALAVGLTAFGGVIGRLSGRIASAFGGTLARIGGDMVESVGSGIARFSPRLANAFVTAVRTAVQVLASVFASLWGVVERVAGAVWGRMGKILHAILKTGFVLALAGAIRSVGDAIVAAATAVYNAAIGLGKAIINGIVSGLSGLYDTVKNYIKDKVKSALDWVKGHVGSTAEEYAAATLGKPLAEGVLRGWIEGSATLPDKMKDKVRAAIEAARTAVTDAKGILGTAFGELVNEALAAFDQLSSRLQTKSEKQLTAMQSAADAASRAKAVADARAALEQARQVSLAANYGLDTSGNQVTDPSQVVANQQAAADALKAAQQTLNDALSAQQQALLEKKAARERAALDDSRALQRRHLEEQLAAAEAGYERGKLTFAQYHLRLLEIMREFHIPFKKGAAALGAALAEGLQDALKSVDAAAQTLAKAITDQLSKIKVVVQVQLISSGIAGGGKAAGGPVTAGVPYLVGEQGPELFMPSTSGTIIPNGGGGRRGMAAAGGVTMNFSFPNYVGSHTELVELVRRGLHDVSRRNVGAIPGVA